MCNELSYKSIIVTKSLEVKEVWQYHFTLLLVMLEGINQLHLLRASSSFKYGSAELLVKWLLVENTSLQNF